MSTNEDKINLRLAKTYAQNAWSVINVDWANVSHIMPSAKFRV